jgi:hypothetical protein
MHIEPSVLDFAIIVLACPHARVNDKLELSAVELEQCYIVMSMQKLSKIPRGMLTRAVEIYSFQQLEEFNSVLWVLGEVFVDHLEYTQRHFP